MIRFAAIFSGIVVFIGLMWLLSLIVDATGSGGYGVVGIIALIIISVVFPAISRWVSEAVEDKGEVIKTKISKEREVVQVVRKAKEDIQEYQSFKNSYSKCSNDFLIASYQRFEDKEKLNFEILAIEEEMVDRGLLDYSPMQEKLLLLSRKFVK